MKNTIALTLTKYQETPNCMKCDAMRTKSEQNCFLQCGEKYKWEKYRHTINIPEAYKYKYLRKKEYL